MQRLLECMSCPFHDTLNLSLKTDVIRLVTWLEDRKVRELEIADRNLLKNADTFDGAFRDYLQALRCPYIYTDATSTQCLDWLVSHAVRFGTFLPIETTLCTRLDSLPNDGPIHLSLSYSVWNSRTMLRHALIWS